jgi:glycosyltransferase involved in cell wall biosynthesis
MHILVLTRYNSLGASSRIRFYQYLPYLESRGVQLLVAPLLSDEYVRSLYTGVRVPTLSVVTAYLHRLVRLLNCRSFDLLWIEKQLFPWFPPWFERVLAVLRIPYVVDYDDAVFHRYDLHPHPIPRLLLGKSINTVMRLAATVVVGNEYLAEHARLSGAGRVETLPSVADIKRYSIGDGTGAQFRVGWIGSPVTTPYLGMISDALEEASQKVNMRLVLVGAGGQDPLPNMEKELLPWTEDTEVATIRSFDVGIMPLPDGPFERGKCGYKLIQYMASGLPVVASPVGANLRIVEQGKTGFLATSTAEWVQALVLLSRSASLQSEMGKAGRKKVEQEYCLQVTAPRLLEILTDAASRKTYD